MDTPKDDVERLITGAHFDQSPRVDHRDELRQRVLTAYDKSQLAPWPIALFLFFQSFWRWVMDRPVPRIGIPVLVLAILLSAIVSLFPARTSFAFEDLIEPLLTAKSARCKIVVRLKDQPALTFNNMFRGTVSRQESKDKGLIMITDETTGAILTLIPKEKNARILQPVNRDPEQSGGGGFLQTIREQLLDLRQDKRVTRVSLGEREVADRMLIGYRINSPAMQLEVWGDQETGLPHTIVSNMAAFPDAEVTMTDFEFDVELDDSLFSLVPPAGYTVTKDTIDLSKPSEEVFTTSLRQFTDLNEGVYPDAINIQEGMKIIGKLRSRTKTTDHEQEQEVNRVLKIVVRGFMFPLRLPAESDAAYAGRGVHRDDAKKPIFWYKPEGAETYRVILADLTAIDSEEPPQADGVQRFTKAPTLNESE